MALPPENPPQSSSSEIPASTNHFPTTLSDLTFNNDSPSLYTVLHQVRRATLTPRPRLQSILLDSSFVTLVSTHYGLPLIANERCGSWYIPPRLKRGSVYFKSTDGHFGQWGFSLRRLNLGLLDVLGRRGGAVLVDSTRRGKGLSDALAKTVVIWVCVVNTVLFPETCCEGVDQKEGKKSTGLRMLQWGTSVGESERAQVEARLVGWRESFRSLGLDLEGLRKRCERPIRIGWALNGVWRADEVLQKKEDENLLVLCSASRRVVGAEGSEEGYVQGAGDDSEGWACGLTPEIFWAHKDEFLEGTEEDFEELVTRYYQEDQAGRASSSVEIQPGGIVSICARRRDHVGAFHLVINCVGSSEVDHPSILDLRCREGKLGSNDLRKHLPNVIKTAEALLRKQPNSKVLITCSTGSDLSVGVALALLCMLFDEEGKLLATEEPVKVDKLLIKKRLAWITNCRSDANPSRSTLQAVNAVLMSRPS